MYESVIWDRTCAHNYHRITRRTKGGAHMWNDYQDEIEISPEELSEFLEECRTEKEMEDERRA